MCQKKSTKINIFSDKSGFISRVISLPLMRRLTGAFIVNVLGVVIAFALQVLLARVLGVESFGQYIYALTWINLCVLVAKFGLDTAALRYIPEYETQMRWGLLKGFLRRSNQIVMMLSITISIIFVIVVSLMGARIDASFSSVFIIACFLLPLSAYTIVKGAYLQGLKHIVFAQAPQVILRPLLMVIGIVFVSQFTSVRSSAEVAIILNIIATCLAIIVLLVLSKLAYPREINTSVAEYQTSEWGKVSFSMMFITGFSLILNQADLIMVGAMVSTTDAGIYAAASRVATFMTFGITLVNLIAAPMMSQLYAEGNISKLKIMLSYTAWGSFIFATPLLVICIFFGEEILSLFGSEFVSGAGALAILAMGRWVNALTGASGFLLAMTGHQKQAAYILGANSLINIALNYILIPYYGINGAAIATLITMVSWSLMMLAYGKKYIGINASLSLKFTWP